MVLWPLDVPAVSIVGRDVLAQISWLFGLVTVG